NTASAEVFTGNNTTNLPPRTRMQTRSRARSTVQDVSVRSYNTLANNVRVPEAPVSQPPCV
ncbi:hypothetical protein HAX54_045213, partial [Datura stramonium]|nr:hypothetical protein [Datura stramonium]